MTNVVFVLFRCQGRFSPFARTVRAIQFFLQILVQLPQTDVDTENQRPRNHRSGLKVPGCGWADGGV